MPKADKNFFAFIKGLNTEVSPLNFPDDTALDIANFELLISGALRRRKGLSLEESGINTDLVEVVSPLDAFSQGKWHGPGGDQSLTFNVVQQGGLIHFYVDSEDLSNNKKSFTIRLIDYKTNDDYAKYPCTFSEGRSKLFIAGRYIETLYITYDADLDSIEINTIEPRFRNFEDAPDDVPIDAQPTETEMPTITAEHFWNLKIRGWKTPDINDYFNTRTPTKQWPAKNMVWHKGYRRKEPVGDTLSTSIFSYQDWIQEWNADKLEAELFSNSSAPRGSLFLNPYDTTTLTGGTAANTLIAIQTWTVSNPTGPIWFVTITTTDPHTRVPGDEIDILNNVFTYQTTSGGDAVAKSLDSKALVCLAGTTGNTIVVNIPQPAERFNNFVTQYATLGYVNTTSLLNPDPYVTEERATACAYWAGRIFLSGMNHPKLSDLILFSQVAVEPDRYGKMYQVGDPTSPVFSELLPDDGGVIQIPGMGTCYAMIPLSNSLIVFGSTGVWEISGGNTYFSATGYGVRKLTDVEALSSISIAKTDFGIFFASHRGIYALAGDEATANLTAQSITETSIQTKWNNIPEAVQPYIQMVYDDALKRVKVLYTETSRPNNPFAYDRELIYDLRLGSWYPYTYPINVDSKYIQGFLPLDTGDNSNENRKIKYFVVEAGTDNLSICDMQKAAATTNKFQDFDGTEQIPYIITGYDNVGDFHTKRQAPYIHVFMQRTEDGFVLNGLDLETRNPSKLTMQSRYDWADDSGSGKWGTAQQVYRIRKVYIPVDINDTYDNGEPVNVAKVKVRGIGRSLHLKFTGATGYDAHLLGWSILYSTKRNNDVGASYGR